MYSEGIPRKTASASKLFQVICRALVKHKSHKLAEASFAFY